MPIYNSPTCNGSKSLHFSVSMWSPKTGSRPKRFAGTSGTPVLDSNGCVLGIVSEVEVREPGTRTGTGGGVYRVEGFRCAWLRNELPQRMRD
jgi:hypothetical protein